MEARTSVLMDIAQLPNSCARVISPYDQLRAAIAHAHPPTADHSIRVRISAASLGSACGLMGHELTTLCIAAEVHDIGKLYVPPSILDKTTPLSGPEWDVIKQHPDLGFGIAVSAFPGQFEIAQCVRYHHERMDGSGYPNGLQGDQIPILARLVAVADAYVAMTEDRPFRAALTDEQALDILFEQDGNKYDPEILSVLERMVNKHRWWAI